MTFFQWIEKYDMFVLLVGALGCIITGMLKSMIKKLINKYQANKIKSCKDDEDKANSYGEKWYKGVLTNWCTAISFLVSCICSILWYCLYLKVLNFYVNANFYLQLLAATTFAKIVYAAYEGIGPVSLKDLIKKIATSIVSQKSGTAITNEVLSENAEQIISAIEAAIPLTEGVRDKILESLKNSGTTTNDEQNNDKDSEE
jgi:hypothetical protein